MNLKKLFINHCEDNQYEINQNQLDIINYLKIYFTENFEPSFFTKFLKKKKNRIILRQNNLTSSKYMFRSILNGVLHQTSDLKTDSIDDMKVKTKNHPSQSQYSDLIFASKIC